MYGFKAVKFDGKRTARKALDTLEDYTLAYKRSNEELYALLDDCLTFFNDLRGNTTKCKALND